MPPTSPLPTRALKPLLISALLTINATAAPTVLTTDVAIIGGGASGTYAAVRLREDLNTSIVLIEPCPNLGGSVSTYRVPSTNTTLEYGVQSYLPYGPALDFFTRFGIATEPFTSRPLTALNIDVETGLKLANYTAPTVDATNAAFGRWLEIVEQYEHMLEPGYWDFPQPGTVPEVLLEPFGVFAKREGIEAAVPRIMTISGVGYGGIGRLLVLHVFQAFGASLTRDMLSNSLFRPVGSNSLLYERALALLEPDVLLSSTVQDVTRTSDGAELLVKQGSTEYLVKARRVLFAAPPSLSNLAPFHPDDKEKAVFEQWAEGGEYVGVAKIGCLPEGVSVSFLPASAAPSNYLALKDYPYNLRLDSTGPAGSNLFRVLFGANFTLTAQIFRDLVASSVQKLRDAGTVTGTCETDFQAVSNHSRPMWKQSAGQIQGGFVQDLYGLQGHRGVWYVGYAWSAPYSSTIWGFAESVLARLVSDVAGGGG
ncbi:hypothetical protein J1614_010030 [Plenodomus biglobosus]|nr:hypothetical protein J1614_010030 [Plenodomus biglobosus]